MASASSSIYMSSSSTETGTSEPSIVIMAQFNLIPMPNSLSEEHRAQLRAGRTIVLQQPPHHSIELRPLHHANSPSSPSPLAAPFHLPDHLGLNEHVRVYSTYHEHGEDHQEAISENMELGYEDTFAIYARLRWTDAEDGSHAPPMLLLAQRANGSGNADAGDPLLYSIVSFDQGEASRSSEDKPAVASMFGPMSDLASLCSACKSHKGAKPVCVAFSAPPLPNPAATATALLGDFRGVLDMPPASLRLTTLALEETNITPGAWVKLLNPIGKQVDLLGTGTAVELMCRETYNPATDTSIHRVPVVLITAAPQSTESAAACMSHIQHLLCTYNYRNIQVNVCIGHISRAVAYRRPHECMGASIGPEDAENRGATMGGFVYLTRNNDARDLCAMTNHHAVVHGHEKIPYDPNAPVRYNVNSPTMALLSDSLKIAKDNLRSAKAELSLSLVMADYAMKDAEISKDQIVYDNCKEVVDLLENRKSDLHLGYVIASSGLVRTPTQAREGDPNDGGQLASEMDWALINVDQRRVPSFPYNKIASNEVEFIVTHKALRNGQLRFESIDSYLEKGKSVAKIDRYSKVAYGELSKFRARAHFPGDSDGGHFYVIPHVSRSLTFGVAGDSGSWVLSTQGTVVGLYTAVTSRNLGPGMGYGSSFIIDIAEVNRDIERETGYAISIADTKM